MSNESASATKSSFSLLAGDTLLKAVAGSLIGRGQLGRLSFTAVATDSRNVCPGTLFVPLIGEKQDGHAYIPQALEKGASVVFVAQSAYEANSAFYESLSASYGDVAFIAVRHTMRALQDAAAAYVEQFPHLVRCAVTGSSGKTTTKEITASILRQKFSLVTNKGNLNSETGLPLSVFQIRPEHELGLFEMGMNRVDEIGEIARVLKPNYGIVTNIGTAHIGILGSREAIAREKKKIFTYLQADGCAVIPAADDFADFLTADLPGRVIRYGVDEKDLQALGVRMLRSDGILGTTFSVDGVEMHLSLPGSHNFANALAAIALARQLDLSPEQIKAGIEAPELAEALGARCRIRKGKYTILEDCYNANPDSMKKALELCAGVQLEAGAWKVLVLGDMLELGKESLSAHLAVAGQAAAVQPDMVLLVGKEMQAARAELAKLCPDCVLLESERHDDEAMAALAAEIQKSAPKGSFILLKGSRGMALERLLPLLLHESAVSPEGATEK